MTVAMLEVSNGRADVARPYLVEVQEIGKQFNNSWLAAGAHVQFAVLATQSGRFDEAHARLRDALATADEGEVMNTHTITFTLVAYAQLALAEGNAVHATLALGAAEGIRQRSGIRAWPSLREGEALLLDWARRDSGEEFETAFRRGSSFTRRNAIDLVRS
jgi:hypothetical protein